MPDENHKNELTIVYPRCEVEETLKGGECELAGEVDFKGVLLCGRHARQLEAQDRVALLRGIISCLEISLRSLPLRRDRNLTLLLRAKRAQTTRELYLAHEDLRRTQEEEDAS
jgi:hypothetical protein